MGPVLALPIVINGVAISSFATVGGAVAATAAITAVALVPGAAQAAHQHQMNGGAPVNFNTESTTTPTNTMPQHHHPPPPPPPPPAPAGNEHVLPTTVKQPAAAKTATTHRDVTPAVREAIASHWADIQQAAANHNLDPYIVAGVISRESNAGRSLDKNGEGDRGRAFGVMQVDYKHSGLTKVAGGDPWSAEHLDQGCKVLREKMDGVARNHPDWSATAKLQGGVAAYNMGVSNVQTEAGIDRGSTGNNYGSDTLARAEALRSQ